MCCRNCLIVLASNSATSRAVAAKAPTERRAEAFAAAAGSGGATAAQGSAADPEAGLWKRSEMLADARLTLRGLYIQARCHVLDPMPRLACHKAVKPASRLRELWGTHARGASGEWEMCPGWEEDCDAGDGALRYAAAPSRWAGHSQRTRHRGRAAVGAGQLDWCASHLTVSGVTQKDCVQLNGGFLDKMAALVAEKWFRMRMSAAQMFTFVRKARSAAKEAGGRAVGEWKWW